MTVLMHALVVVYACFGDLPSVDDDCSTCSARSVESMGMSLIADDGASDGDPSFMSTSARLNRPEHLSGMCGASFNFVNSIVGAGIIGIPFAIKRW